MKEEVRLTEYDRKQLLISSRKALAGMRTMSEHSYCRALSLAITHTEEAIHWLQDPSIVREEDMSNVSEVDHA